MNKNWHPLGVTSLAVVGGVLSVPAVVNLASSISRGETGTVLQLIVGGLVLALVTVTALAAFQIRVHIRNARLVATNANARIYASIQVASLTAALTALEQAERTHIGAWPYSLSVLFGIDEIEIWGGGTRPRKYATFSRSAVSQVRVVNVDSFLRGFELTVRTAQGEVALPFAIFDAGPLRAFSPSLAALRTQADRWSRARAA